MAGGAHEGTIELLRQAPSFVLELARGAPEVRQWKSAQVEPDDGSLGAVKSPELHADGVLVLTRGRQRVGVVLEVQSTRDNRKRLSWPAYVTSLRLRRDVPVVLLVIALSRQVAQWARTTIELGGGNVFAPLVVGPDDVPAILDPERAKLDPEWALLSVILHRNDGRAAQVAQAATIAADGLSPERGEAYLDIIHAALSSARHRELRELMQQSGYQPISDWARRHFQRGKAEGREEGRGQLVGALLDVLAARGLEPSRKAVARIEACDDLLELRGWLRSAATASSLDDVFGASPLR